MSPMAAGHSYAAGNYALELEGVVCGLLKSVSGGTTATTVIKEKPGPDYFGNKHISPPKYGEFQIKSGAGMSSKFFDWIKTSIGGLHGRRNGSIVAFDYDFKERERRDFTNALITEISFPACDASSKDPAVLVVNFKPEMVRMKQGNNSTTSSRGAQKQWMMNGFRLDIASTDCSGINKVEGMQFKPPSTRCPNLLVTLAEARAKSFYDWHQTFVVKGNESATREGTLSYLTPDLTRELFSLSFHNLGISKLTADKTPAHSDNIHRVKVEMYTERIDFKYGQGTWA